MSFLLARAADGSLCQFARNELAYFFPVRSQREAAFHERREFRAEGVVFSARELRWFIGEFEVRDFLPRERPLPAQPRSDQCPAPPSPSLDPSPPPNPSAVVHPDPYAAVRVICYRDFVPTEVFREVSPADAAEWLLSRHDSIPSKAQAALDMTAPAVRQPEPTPHEGGRPERLTPGARAIAAAYDLQREGKPVSERAACGRARFDRANLRKRYPEAVAAIEAFSRPQTAPRRGVRDRRTGDVHAVVFDDD
jgi:hypothetical protein